MKLSSPTKLLPNDLIAITAPSMGVPESYHARLDIIIDYLKKKGFRVLEGTCLRSVCKSASANRAERAKELNSFLLNAEIKAIMPPWGGELAMDILELIDFQALSEIRPKWFCGYSDLSTLQLPMTIISGWKTLHSPNLMEFGIDSADEVTKKIWRILQADKGEIIEQRSSLYYQTKENNWEINPNESFNPTVRTHWKRLDGSSSPISFKGRLIGGCLETISRLAGTEYGKIPKFTQENLKDGTILYFESSELNSCELARCLLSLKMHGWFNNLTGILIGRSIFEETNNANQLNHIDALQLALANIPVPIIYNVDVGHVPPQISLINGALTEVSFSFDFSQVNQSI